jgi:septal ring factor EnvC (AmiA/AmiB activator)
MLPIGQPHGDTPQLSLNVKHAAFLLAVAASLTNVSCSGHSAAPADDRSDDEQLDRADRQADKMDEQAQRADRILAKQEAQIDKADEQLRRYDALLEKLEKQAQRYDAILDKWETQASPTEPELSKTLPLAPAARDALFRQFREQFNAHDGSAVYKSLSAYAHARIDREQFDAQLEKMFEWFGRIQSGDHSQTTFVRNQDGLDVFGVRYTARFSGGILAEQGTVRLTVSYDGNAAELVGVNMQADATQP